MALESGELAAEVIVRQRDKLDSTSLAADYADSYRKKFDSRLKICSLLRRAAFSPRLAELGVTVFGASERLRNRVARATRSPAKVNHRSV